MKPAFRVLFRILAIGVSLVAGPAFAHDYTVGSLAIGHPWARATPKGAPVAGGYMTIANKGSEADRLVGGSADFATRVEIHQMTMEQGVMKMRPLKDGLEIKPGASVELKPGSYHLMFISPKQPLVQGQSVKATLKFDKAGPLDVEFTVEGLGANPPSDMPGMPGMSPKGMGPMGH
jgi:copper(I)-binding protein